MRNTMRFGDFLKEHRRISTTKLGEKAGVSGTYISYIENGDRMPSLEVAENILKALRVKYKIVGLELIVLDGNIALDYGQVAAGRGRRRVSGTSRRVSVSSASVITLEEAETQLRTINELMHQLRAQRNELSALVNKMKRKDDLSDLMREALDFVTRHPGCVRGEVFASLNVSDKVYANTMTSLVRHKKIINLGTRRNPQWYPL